MAAPIPTTYYVGIGTAISNLGVPTELSGGSYARLVCAFTGTAVSGLTQSFSIFVVATAPTPAVPMVYGLLYDALTGGNLIAYWNWAQPYTTSLTAFPATVVNITFNTYVSQALNLALQGGQGSSGSLIDAGAQIGTVNGNPMLAGSRLGVGTGGSLVAHLGQGQWMSSADVQNGLYSGAFGSGNIVSGVTAFAGGGTATLSAVPVMSGCINRVAIAATANDSVILPGPTLTPGAPGSILWVSNGAAANAIKVWPDVGATINGATTLVMAAGTGATMLRLSSTAWVSIPLLPS